MADPRPLLVVDDGPHIWHLLALSFTRMGFAVPVAPVLALTGDIEDAVETRRTR